MAFNTYTLIQSQTLSSTATSVTFSSIPSTYTDLLIKLSVRDARATLAVSDIWFNFNGLGSGTNITGRYLYGDGSSASATTVTSNGELAFGSGNGATANTFGNADVYISNYAGSTNKSISSESVAETGATGGFNLLLSGLWTNTAAITSIAMTPFTSPFAINSSFYLYGIKNS
jgi:hypothetical protein